MDQASRDPIDLLAEIRDRLGDLPEQVAALALDRPTPAMPAAKSPEAGPGAELGRLLPRPAVQPQALAPDWPATPAPMAAPIADWPITPARTALEAPTPLPMPEMPERPQVENMRGPEASPSPAASAVVSGVVADRSSGGQQSEFGEMIGLLRQLVTIAQQQESKAAPRDLPKAEGTQLWASSWGALVDRVGGAGGRDDSNQGRRSKSE